MTCVLTRAKLNYSTAVPETGRLPPHLTKTMVTEMHTGLDLDTIKTGNKQIIKRTFLLLFSVFHFSYDRYLVLNLERLLLRD